LRNQPALFGTVASTPTAWRTLEAVDAGTLEAALDEAVADAVKAYPAIKRPTYPDRSGASFPAGSSQSEILTRDVIAQMTPEAVNQARKAGMIPGFAADAS